jgi:hypothetical protein
VGVGAVSIYRVVSVVDGGLEEVVVRVVAL